MRKMGRLLIGLALIFTLISCMDLLSLLNTAPNADAGSDQTTTAQTLVTLNGSGSSDEDGDLLDYRWSVQTSPTGSSVSLSNTQAASPSFTPATSGTYIFLLSVSDGIESDSDTVTITVEDFCSPPIITPAGGTYSSVVNCTITGDSGNSIYYTLDGTVPTAGSVLYSGGFQILSDTLVQAICLDGGGVRSEIASTQYYITAALTDLPVFSPAEGSYSGAFYCTITAEAGSTIYYTLKTDTPSSSSYIYPYSTPLAITENSQITAYYINSAGFLSESAQVRYILDAESPDPPVIAPSAGAYNQAFDCTITAETGSTIYYTLDGKEPSQSSTVYTAAFSIDGDTLVKTLCVDNAGNESIVASIQYTIDAIAPDAPTFSPAAGTYGTALNCSISCENGSVIYYTLDGKIPTDSSTVYSGAFTIGEDTTVQALCVDSAGNVSASASVSYTFDTLAPAAPTFSPAAGIFNSGFYCTLSGEADALIFYTLDGNTPTIDSTQYSSAIPVNTDTLVQAICVDGVGNVSPASSAQYTIDTEAPAAPVISPAEGAYPAAFSCSISGEPGASIYYTLDGNPPTTGSTGYSGAFTVRADTLVKALCVDLAGNVSPIASIPYIIDTDVPASPDISPAVGTYGEEVSCSISGEPNAAIYYTIDGNPPTTSSAKYTEAFPVSTDTLVSAICVDRVGNISAVAFADYIIDTSAPEAPTFSPVTGLYNSAVTCRISAETGTEIYLTIDGSAPTLGSPVYSGAFSIGMDTTVRALCVDSVGNVSEEGFALYTFDLDAPDAPVVSPEAGTYGGGLNCTLSGETGATIYYTVNGSTPSITSTKYTGAFSIGSDAMVQAICVDSAGNISSMVSAEYIIDTAAPEAPSISPVAGLYNSAVSCRISGETGAVIYYTIDGNTPTIGSAVYSGAFPIGSDTTVRALCVDSVGNISEEASAGYTFDFVTPDVPVISPAAGTYHSITSCSITAETGSRIYYTLDGSTPTTESTLYGGVFHLSSTSTVKALCLDGAGNVSGVTSVPYTIDLIIPEAPVIAPAAGSHYGALECSITAETGSSIYYTLDGNIPTTGSTVYSGAFEISADTTVQAFCINSYGNASTVTSAQYDIEYRGDLFIDEVLIGTNWFYDTNSVTVGATVSLEMYLRNVGNLAINNSGVDMDFYLSTDNTITTSDTLIFSTAKTLSLDPGESVLLSISNMGVTLPSSLVEGRYYVGCMVDTQNVVTEIDETNNVSTGDALDDFFITDPASVGSGAFKLMNSWGTSTTSTWENVHDGHYWIDYESAKSLNMAIYYYFNDFSEVYEPSIVAVFNVSHETVDECILRLGLGDPEDPIMEKTFQSTFNSSSYSGGTAPFPSNDMVLDISEFASEITNYPLYLVADTTSGTESGTLNSFSVEFYSTYGSAPIETLNCTTTGALSAGSVNVFTIDTASLSTGTRGVLETDTETAREGISFVQEVPDAAELAHDQKIMGVYDPSVNYNVIVDGFGTGAVPPTEEEWSQMQKLRSFSSGIDYGTLPEEVDLSATPWFPPVGNQGAEGSCVGFAVGYYVHTYNEAREHGWDLSSTNWIASPYPGEPSAHQDQIMSPDFLYHQINNGSSGANQTTASRFIVSTGLSSWEQMPYSDDDDNNDAYPWPSEAAYREAPLYRGNEVGNDRWDHPSGYFILDTDDEISLLKQLLVAGYCVSTSIEAEALYNLLSSEDAVIGYNGGPMSTNHAQALVGYKEDSEWDSGNPEN